MARLTDSRWKPLPLAVIIFLTFRPRMLLRIVPSFERDNYGNRWREEKRGFDGGARRRQ